MRLIGEARCLLVIQSSHETLSIYMSCTHTLEEALQDPPRRTFHLSKLGQDPLFAVDESRRLIVLYGNPEVSLAYLLYVSTNSYSGSRAYHSIFVR